MTPPGTFDRVYSALRTRLRSGAYRPGTRLEPAVLADELNASVTPVRDALHRLTGERLVDAPRHEGFRVPMMSEPLLRQLYQWHRDLLLLALSSHGHQQPVKEASRAAEGTSLDERQAALFSLLTHMTRNVEHSAALESARARIEPARRFEALFLDGIEDEIGDILSALREHNTRRLRQALIRYHRRRERIVPEVLAKLLEN